MNPFNTQQQNPAPMNGGQSAPPGESMGSQGHKRRLLHHLVNTAMGTTAGKGLAETISGIKNAIGAYKNYAKEWDNLNGMGDSAKKQATQEATRTQMPPASMSMQTPQNIQFPQ